MNRSVLIAVIVVLLAAITLVVLGLAGVIGKNENANVTNTTANTNTATNSTEADIVRTLNAPIAYRTGTLTAQRAESRQAISGFTASAGTKYVVVYFEPSALDFDAPFVSWLTNEVTLLDGGETATKPTFAHMEGDQAASADDNFLAFRVDDAAEKFTLRFLHDGEDKRLPLGF